MENLLPGNGQQNNATLTQTDESLIQGLSHQDREVRRNAVIALMRAGDARAARPLARLLYREIARSASSYPLIVDILDALAVLPDRYGLDALIKIERQMVDRASPRCPKQLRAGVITYADPVDGSICRAVPRELHIKTLDVMRQLSVRLGYRVEEIDERYRDYQREVISEEIDRVMPGIVDIFKESDSYEAKSVSENDEADFLSQVADAGIDYDALRQELEQEVAGYFKDNDKLMVLIRNGQRIKAHIRVAKEKKTDLQARSVSAR